MNNVVISILGTVLDQRGKHSKRWTKWRPNVSLCQHSELPIHRLELLHDNHSQQLANQIIEDIQSISEHTEVNTHILNFKDPWDFESVYSTLLDFAQSYQFKPSKERRLPSSELHT